MSEILITQEPSAPTLVSDGLRSISIGAVLVEVS